MYICTDRGNREASSRPNEHHSIPTALSPPLQYQCITTYTTYVQHHQYHQHYHRHHNHNHHHHQQQHHHSSHRHHLQHHPSAIMRRTRMQVARMSMSTHTMHTMPTTWGLVEAYCVCVVCSCVRQCDMSVHVLYRTCIYYIICMCIVVVNPCESIYDYNWGAPGKRPSPSTKPTAIKITSTRCTAIPHMHRHHSFKLCRSFLECTQFTPTITTSTPLPPSLSSSRLI